MSTGGDVLAKLTNELQRAYEDNKLAKKRVETMRDENDSLSLQLLEKQQEVETYGIQNVELYEDCCSGEL